VVVIMAPVTRYARSGEASIAYQVVGEGEVDLVFVLGWVSNIEHLWQSPPVRRFIERFGAFARVIVFDRRGSGLSDSDGQYTIEQDVVDVLAVMDAAWQRSSGGGDLWSGWSGRGASCGRAPGASGGVDHVRVGRALIVGSGL
jgi:hypothetical protein